MDRRWQWLRLRQEFDFFVKLLWPNIKVDVDQLNNSHHVVKPVIAGPTHLKLPFSIRHFLKHSKFRRLNILQMDLNFYIIKNKNYLKFEGKKDNFFVALPSQCA